MTAIFATAACFVDIFYEYELWAWSKSKIADKVHAA